VSKINDSDFLDENAGMSPGPFKNGCVTYRGQFDFHCQAPDGVEIKHFYYVEIFIPLNFPRELPKVWELKEEIPRDGKHHTNHDGSLCLGSPIRVLKQLNINPTLLGFAKNCLTPFLYTITRQIQRGDGFINGELDHGEPGIVDDYQSLFNLKTKKQVLTLLHLLSMKKREANKKPCPCLCGQRLGKCTLRFKVNSIRKMAARSWFRRHSLNPGGGM
jgi:hypothetical protein